MVGQENLLSTIPVRVAFRLTEPEEDSDSAEWLLETGYYRGTWTSLDTAVRKRNFPVEEALPERWKQYADEIDEKTIRNDFFFTFHRN